MGFDLPSFLTPTSTLSQTADGNRAYSAVFDEESSICFLHFFSAIMSLLTKTCYQFRSPGKARQTLSNSFLFMISAVLKNHLWKLLIRIVCCIGYAYACYRTKQNNNVFTSVAVAACVCFSNTLSAPLHAYNLHWVHKQKPKLFWSTKSFKLDIEG